MKISNVNRINQEAEKTNAFQASDSESKDVMNQISSAQKKLKELASDHQLNEEEKAKKRKEIQQQIAELNKQLKQHQMELRRQQEKEKAANVSEEEEEKQKLQEETEVKADLSGTKAIISANSAISQAKAQGNLALSMEGRVRVLQSEISQDERYGKNTDQKQKELKKLEQKAIKVKGAKMSYLSKASREMRESAARDQKADMKSGTKKESAFVNPASPMRSAGKSRTDIYIRGNMFSHVDFHF